MHHLYKMFGKGKAWETEGRLVVAWVGGGTGSDLKDLVSGVG